MSTEAAHIPRTRTQAQVRPRPMTSRGEALKIAEARKAARRRRTLRIRRAVAVFAVAAFIGPLGIISAKMAAGRDPVLSASTHIATKAAIVASTQSATPASAGNTATSSGTTATSSGTTGTSSGQAPSAVTTRQS